MSEPADDERPVHAESEVDPLVAPPPPGPASAAGLAARVGQKASRKLRAQRHRTRTVWFGLGMMGLVGWSVAVPTVLGVALGRWLDRRYPGPQSFTLMLLLVGLALGCFNAWRWVTKEDREIAREQERGDE